MNPDQRLDQLELLMVDVLKKQDELAVKSDYHTAQIKALAAMIMDVNVSLTVHKMDTDKKFDSIDKRFEQVDKRFEQIDKRFENVDNQLAGQGAKLDLILSILQNRNGH
jgi:septal ring factor EnvC (AmiA/AmiB activator)